MPFLPWRFHHMRIERLLSMPDEEEAIFGLRCFFTCKFAGPWPGGVFAWTTKIQEKNKAVLYDPALLVELLDASEVQVWVFNTATLVLWAAVSLLHVGRTLKPIEKIKTLRSPCLGWKWWFLHPSEMLWRIIRTRRQWSWYCFCFVFLSVCPLSF